jgi:phosphoglycolate phosphatase-like HAD superfamily hydrolase
MNPGPAGGVPPDCVLFDLDGTLLDTAPDMTAAVNRLRQERHLPALPVAAIRPTVSHGSPGMLKAGFGLTPDDPLYAELNPRFLALYREAIAVETALFPGMAEVLDHLEARFDPLGGGHQQAGLADRAAAEGARIYGREWRCAWSAAIPWSARKPDPEPLLYACDPASELLPGRSLYVGDAERDMLAGKQAGMTALVAGFGYLGAEDRPEHWNADGFLRQPSDLFAWLGGPAAPATRNR